MLVLLASAQVGSEPDWLAVPLQPGHVAVLGGHTLEFATGGTLCATEHRVVVRRRPRLGLFGNLIPRVTFGSGRMLIMVGSCINVRIRACLLEHAIEPMWSYAGVCLSAHLVIASKPSDKPCFTHVITPVLCSVPQLCHYRIS